MIGAFDYGSVGSFKKGNSFSGDGIATEALTFMLVGLNGEWKWSIGYVLKNNLTATMQAQLIKSALILVDEHNLHVSSLT